MSEIIDWSNEEIVEVAAKLNNIGLHLRNAIACMYNTCTRLANNRYWTGYNFNIVAKQMNGHVEKYQKDADYFSIEVPSIILEIAKIQAQSGGGVISATIPAGNGDRDWLIQRVPETTVNASGDQVVNIEEINKFLEDPGTAVSMAYFIHGDEGGSIKGYLGLYMKVFDEFYNAIKDTDAMVKVKEQLQIDQERMLYQAEEFYEIIKNEANMAKDGIVDTDEKGVREAKEALASSGSSSENDTPDSTIPGADPDTTIPGDAGNANGSSTGFIDAEIPETDEEKAAREASEKEAKERKELYDKLDTNKDGIVDLNDAPDYNANDFYYGEWGKNYKEYIEKYGTNPLRDINADGKITPEDALLREENNAKQAVNNDNNDYQFISVKNNADEENLKQGDVVLGRRHG